MKDPLEPVSRLDQDYIADIWKESAEVFAEGNVPGKYKLMMAMALDAVNGDTDGVKALTGRAMEAGLSRKELLEIIKVIHHVTGVGKVFVIAKALDGLL